MRTNSLGFSSYFHHLCFSDSDLHMTALALELCCTLMGDRRSSPSVGLAVRNKVLPQALTLIKSSLLQGQALLVVFMHVIEHVPFLFDTKYVHS